MPLLTILFQQNNSSLQKPTVPPKSPHRPPPYALLATLQNQPPPSTYTQIDEGANRSQCSTTTNYGLSFQKIRAEGHANQHNGPEYQNGFVPGLTSHYEEVTAQDNVKQHNGAKIVSIPSESKSGEQNTGN